MELHSPRYAVPHLAKFIHSRNGQPVRFYQAVVNQPADVFDGFQVIRVLGIDGNCAVFQHNIVLVGRNAVCAEDRIKGPGVRVGGQAKGILFSISIRVVVGERVIHVVQLVQIGGHFHPQVFQPVDADIQVIGISQLA